MKKILFSVMLVISALTINAQQRIELKLWEQGAPNSNGMTGNEEAVSKKQLTYVAEPTLTVYPAPENKRNGMAIVACPGGAYSHLATGHEGHDMASWFNAQGITYAVLVYRMPNGHYEVPLSDAQQAIRLMRKHASEWGVNNNKIGIMGSSAGGHLASTAATHFENNEVRPDFQILFYPVISMDEKITHKGSRNNLLGKTPNEETVKLYCNELQVTNNTPQAFILHSSDDKAVPVENSLRYYRALIQNNVSATMHLYPIGGHGWGFNDNFIYKRQWTGELEKWLREINK